MELYGRCLCGLLKNYRSISLWSHVKKKELLQSSTIQYIRDTGEVARKRERTATRAQGRERESERRHWRERASKRRHGRSAAYEC